MTNTKTPVSRNAKHVLTEEEIKQHNEALLAALQAKKEIEAEKKEVASAYKNKIAEQELAIDKISNLMRVGYEIRPFQCYMEKNFDTGKREYYEFGSDKLIDSEPLNAADYQMDLEMQEEAIRQNNEQDAPKDQLQEVIDERLAEAQPFEEAVEPTKDAPEPTGTIVEKPSKPKGGIKEADNVVPMSFEEKEISDPFVGPTEPETFNDEDDEDPFDFGDI